MDRVNRAVKKVLFEPMGVFTAVDGERTLLELALAAGLAIRTDCGGQGKCGQCRVKVSPPESFSPLTEIESETLSAEELAAGFRLACQTKPFGRATVSVPEGVMDSGQALGKTGLDGRFVVRPMVERIVLPGEPAVSEGRADDLASLIGDRIEAVSGRRIEPREIAALRDLSRLQAAGGEVTLIRHRRRGLTAVLAGRRPRSLGLAVDVGTTTLAGYLCDLTTGRVLASAGAANPQRRFGEDVISRIAHAAAEPEGLDELRRLVIEAVNRLLAHCLESTGAKSRDVDEVTLVGNPTMLHLALGLHPRSLGVAPYRPVSRRMGDFEAAELDLDLNPATNVHVLPVISGYIGGDAVGAILAARPQDGEETTLIVDIGTNGELILGDKRGLWATSCATGPALEGAHISCGMRAAAGAIHRFDNEPGSPGLVYEVVGGRERRPAGLCGSGVIDLAAALRRNGALLESGGFNADAPGVVVDGDGVGRGYLIVPAEETAAGRELVLELKDVRQIQLAKAALRAGIDILMGVAGVERIDRLVLTGAFGARFDWRNAVVIGMLPPSAVAGRVEIQENGAGLGAIIALLDREARAEAGRLSERVTTVDLAARPEFNQAYLAAMAFPPLGGEAPAEGG